jgi:MFS family permease
MTIWIRAIIYQLTGSGLTALTLGVFVFNNYHSAAILIHSFFVNVCSFIFIASDYGSLSDRIDRSELMIIGDFSAISGILFILIIMYTQKFELWHIYLGVTMSSLFNSVQIPAYKAIVTDLVDEKSYSKASGLIQFAGSAQYLVSPILAGVLVKFFDIKIILIIDIATFLLPLCRIYS